MKKHVLQIVSSFLAIILLFSTPAIGIGTSLNLSISVDGTDLALGDTLRIILSVRDMNVSSFSGGIRFDCEALECVSVQGVRPGKTERLYLLDCYGDWVAASAVSTTEEANLTGTVGFVWIGTEDTAYPAQEIAVVTLRAVAVGKTSIRLYEDSAGESGVSVDMAQVQPDGVVTIEITAPDSDTPGSETENQVDVHDGATADDTEPTEQPTPEEPAEPMGPESEDRSSESGAENEISPAVYPEEPDYEVELHDTACSRDNSCPLSRFGDLDMGLWYHDGIHYVLEAGLMVGLDEETFAPGTTASRAMIVTILWRMEGQPAAPGNVSFLDVPAGRWYTEPIRWAADREIVTGFPDGTFDPSASVTREQLVTILYRYAAFLGLSTDVQED